MRWKMGWIQWIRKEGINIGISLATAVMVCFFISEEISGERTFEVPIRFELPKGKKYQGVQVVWQSIQTVQVKVQGPKVKLSFLPQNLVLRPKIPQGTPQGEKVVLPLSSEYLSLPPGVRCREIVPPQVEFILSRMGEKKVPVELQLTPPTLPPHIQIEYYEPESVTLRGPLYLLEKIHKVSTTPIHWKSIHSSRVKRFSVQIPRPFRKQVRCDQTIAVKFSVTEPLEKITLLLRVFILLSEDFPFEVDLHTKKLRLTFQGPKKTLELLKMSPEKYLDVYIVPEELDQSEIRAMDKNSDPPKELKPKIYVSPELGKLKLPPLKDRPVVKFYLLKKKD